MKRLISLFLAIIMIISLVGCNNKGSVNSVIDDFFSAVQKYDMKKIDTFFQDADEIKAAKIIDSKTPQYSYMKQKAVEITYEIKDVKEKGNTAEATVLCSYYNMTDVYSTMMLKAYQLVLEGVDISVTGEEFDNIVKKAFDEALASNPPKKESKSLKIELQKVDNKWYIKGNMDIANMITGNLAETLSNFGSK